MNQVAQIFAKESPRFARSNIAFYKKHTKDMPQDFKREMSLRYVRAVNDSGVKTANKVLRGISRNVTASGLALAADDDALIQVGRNKSKDMARLFARYVTGYNLGFNLKVIRVFKCGLLKLDKVGRLNVAWVKNNRAPFIGCTELTWGELKERGKIIDVEDLPAANVTELLQHMQAFCRNQGITPPMPDPARNVTESGCIRRLMCDRWWVRNLRKAHARAVELAAIQVGLVSKYKSPYVSEASMKRRLGQKKRNASLLASIVAVNELGYERTLEELASIGVANPAVRFAEMMTRLRGMEEIADKSGKVCDFWTLTCPSKMHASSKKYDGTTPRQAQQYLTKVWARIRSACKRHGIKLSGIRVAEPHQDACPHWHMLLWIDDNPMDAEVACFFINKYALEVDGNETGAAENRTDVKRMDKKEGSAVGYVIKYIGKNIGSGDDADFNGEGYFSKDENGDRIYHDGSKADAVQRVEAWASTWGIRQFQFVGSDSVTLWRELRRVRKENKDSLGVEAIKHPRFKRWGMRVKKGIDPVLWKMLVWLPTDTGAHHIARLGVSSFGASALKVMHENGLDFSPFGALKNIGGNMQKAWKFADAGEWEGYSRYAGSLELLRISSHGELNAYNEPKAKQVMGIKSGSQILITRRHVWKVEKASKEQLNSAENRREAAEKAALAAPWTRVNNCTESKKQATTDLCLKNRHKRAHAPPIP